MYFYLSKGEVNNLSRNANEGFKSLSLLNVHRKGIQEKTFSSLVNGFDHGLCQKVQDDRLKTRG